MQVHIIKELSVVHNQVSLGRNCYALIMRGWGTCTKSQPRVVCCKLVSVFFFQVYNSHMPQDLYRPKVNINFVSAVGAITLCFVGCWHVALLCHSPLSLLDAYFAVHASTTLLFIPHLLFNFCRCFKIVNSLAIGSL